MRNPVRNSDTSDSNTTPKIETSAAKKSIELHPEWRKAFGPFADVLGLSLEEATERLLAVSPALIRAADEKGARQVANPEYVSNDDLRNIFTEAAKADFFEAIDALRRTSAKPTETARSDGNARSVGMMAGSVLPNVPGEAILTDSLRTGGVSKVEPSHVVALARGLCADQLGLYGVREAILMAIETRLKGLDEPAPLELLQLRRAVKRRAHSDVLASLQDEADVKVGAEDCNSLIKAGREVLIPALWAYYSKLVQWRQDALANAQMTTMQGAPLGMNTGMDPGVLALMSQATQINTRTVREGVAAVNNAINRTFRLYGVIASVAVLEEAKTARALLEDVRLRMLMGKTTQLEALAALGIAVDDGVQTNEQELAQFVIGVMALPKVPIDREMLYLAQLISSGTNVNWPQFGIPQRDAPRPTGIGGTQFGSSGRAHPMSHPHIREI